MTGVGHPFAPRWRGRCAVYLLAGVLLGCGTAPVEPARAPAGIPSQGDEAATGDARAAPTPQQAKGVSERIRAILDAADRSDKDRALDPGRRPGELLAFLDLAPGMKIAEIGAGTGYTTELLARAVAPGGAVYAVNSQWVLERFAEQPWSERLAKPAMQNVVRLDRPFDDPFPEGLTGLDLVCSVLVYHDFFWMEVDRAAMNAAVFRALAPGGSYVVIDHAAQEGSGARDVRSLHRVDAATVRAELEQAGFVFAAEADFLHNPKDARDWNAAPTAAAQRRGESHRFVLRFTKP